MRAAAETETAAAPAANAGAEPALATGADPSPPAPAGATLEPWLQFICRACGLIYDESAGDPDSGIAPGTRFADIPDDWSCPLCGVGKSDFEPFDPTPVPARATRRGAAVAPASHAVADVLIVGAGTAGWQMAEALRALDPGLRISLVDAGAGDRYDKPLLSVACERGLGIDALVKETATAAADRLGVRLLADTHAVRIDPVTRRLRTSRGPIGYRHLVLAHGAVPRASAELPSSLCWRINDLGAYRGLRARLAGGPQAIAIVGAGLVGCELANDLALEGHAVTLLDPQGRPLATHLPEPATRRLLEAWEGLPLRFFGGLAVAGVRRTGTGAVVATVCGRRFEAAHVVAATGLAPEHRLARSAGLQVDAAGVVADPATLRTSDPAIFALGDCASLGGRAQRYIEPIGRQARAIASAIASASTGTGTATATVTDAFRFEPREIPLRIKTGSMPFSVHGSPHPQGRWSVEVETADTLEMTQRLGDQPIARLEGRRARAGAERRRLAA